MRADPKLYSATPLLERLREPTLTNRNLTHLGVTDRIARTISQCDGWLTERQADQIATMLGTHIDLLWPENAWIDRWIATDLDDLTDWVNQWMDRSGIQRWDTTHCGTNRGYAIHKRNGNPPCPECVSAHTQITAYWKRQNRAKRTVA